MRKFALGLVLAIAVIGLATAQGFPGGGPQGQAQQGQGQQGQSFQTPMGQLQAKSIEGKLGFIDNRPTLVTKDTTYFLDMREFFYYAYTDGIKSGDTVKADGFVLPSLPGQDKPGFIVTKAVINGKTYDFTAGFGRGMMGGFGRGGHRGMMGQGGGYGPMMGGQGYGPNGGRW